MNLALAVASAVLVTLVATNATIVMTKNWGFVPATNQHKALTR